MNELQSALWIERYRPSTLEDLILKDKQLLCKFLSTPLSMPSLVFYSSKPGTGKTSAAKLIGILLGCDVLALNSSLERGIDAIRDRINNFARASSSNPAVKRCVLLDEADGLTKQAQDSLRNLMEEYSDNCFFILTANDLNKIIEPIRSRCQLISFENPNRAAIEERLLQICEEQNLETSTIDLPLLIENHYPDMRCMINQLQAGRSANESTFESFLAVIKSKQVKEIYDTVYSGSFDCLGFNKWLFRWLFEQYQPSKQDSQYKIALRLADTEKHATLGCNLEVIFIANILEVMNLL